jgi:hypothetical protein
LYFGQNIFHRLAAGWTSSNSRQAVSAAVITAILNLDESTSAFSDAGDRLSWDPFVLECVVGEIEHIRY